MARYFLGCPGAFQPLRGAIACFALCLLAGLAFAQSPAAAPPTKAPGTLPQPSVTVNPQVIVGRWIHTRHDAETRTSDTVVIEFMADGRYQAKNRHNLLPTPERPSQGRYAIANVQRNAFDLRIERSLADPESDPQDSVEIQRITVVDRDTLQAADGSVVRRVKE